LFYSFLHKGRLGDFASLFTGATIKHLPRQQLAKVKVAFPEREVQSRIADILSAYDDLIENNRRRMTLLEQAAREHYREWFVRLRFPGYEHTRITDGVPDGWRRRSLEDLCVQGDGIQTGPFGSQLHQSDYSDEGVPVIMPKDLVGFRVALESVARIPESLANKLGRHRMTAGDTVYGRRGDIGRRAFIGKRQEGWFCGTGCLRIRPDPAAVNRRYLFDTLGSPDTAGLIANRAKGATMPNLNATLMRSVPILVAPRKLQDHYSEYIEPSFELTDVLDEQNRKLHAARDLFLPRLMSGQIAV
jgi:type I restriction enzyme S subunit